MNEITNTDLILERINRNITFLLAEKKLKKSDLEVNAGFSPGYLSRFKIGSGSLPSVQFMISASTQLNVSIDRLIKSDITKVKPSMKQPTAVLEKLISDTETGKVNWDQITLTDVKEALVNKDKLFDEHFIDNFRYINQNLAKPFGGDVLVEDYSEEDHKDITPYAYYLDGPIFRALFPSKITFMILQMLRIHRDSKKKDRVFSLCVNRGGFLYKLFTVSSDSDAPLSLMFKQLVNEIEESLQDFISNGDYAQVMKLYLENDNLDKSYTENRILSEDE